MRSGRLLAACLALSAIGIGLTGIARADGGATWRYVPALPPVPPPGVAPAPYPVPLGEVGQVSFWAPNRGLLITGGTVGSGGVVASGLYAYNGADWHQLSTVCGGGEGRIAWAGPDEFWTIADQRAGQVTSTAQGALASLSLCHFLDGQVVGSYALLLGEPESYLQMDAAACLSAQDCWFAGEVGQPPNAGSFHLHWNGSEVSEIYDPADHAVTGMADFAGKLYEGLAIAPEDSYLPGEEPAHPPVVRTIASGATSLCEGVSDLFCNVFLFSEAPLPVYPKGVLPDALSGFDIASDGSPLGSGATQLWAGADPVHPGGGGAPPGSTRAPVTILRDLGGSWEQILPLATGTPPLGEAYLAGSETDEFSSQAAPVGNSIAPEPGTESAWLSLHGAGSGATVALLEAGAEEDAGAAAGNIVEMESLPGPQDPVGNRGQAGPITCPAIHDCWMATSEGWLFHLTTDLTHPAVTAGYQEDTDADFAGVVSYRPPDAGVPVIYPDVPPADDSLANQPPPAPTGLPAQRPVPTKERKHAKPLVEHVKSSFVRRHVLILSFTLTGRARVQLIARARGKVVARTRAEALRTGRHQLSLALDPARWPNKLQFKATPIGGSNGSDGSGGSSESNDTVSTG